jgi:hypothetical protein
MPVAIPEQSEMSILQVADLDVYRNPESTEEQRLAECKKVRSAVRDC